MTGEQLQRTIVDMARLLGWKVAHFRSAQTATGWRTPVAADAKGWPDLCLVRDRIVWLETKGASEKLTDEQGEWIAAINNAGGTALVVRPKDLPEIERALKRRAERPAPPLPPPSTPHVYVEKGALGSGKVTRR
jgi:hypothetical protein